jgi:hypothetical protein
MPAEGNMDYLYDDGGDPDGINNNNCVPRSIAIVTGRPIGEVLEAIKGARGPGVSLEGYEAWGLKPDEALAEYEKELKEYEEKWGENPGADLDRIEEYLEELGFVGPLDPPIPTTGRMIVSFVKPGAVGHMTAVIDGVVHDPSAAWCERFDYADRYWVLDTQDEGV